MTNEEWALLQDATNRLRGAGNILNKIYYNNVGDGKEITREYTLFLGLMHQACRSANRLQGVINAHWSAIAAEKAGDTAAEAARGAAEAHGLPSITTNQALDDDGSATGGRSMTPLELEAAVDAVVVPDVENRHTTEDDGAIPLESRIMNVTAAPPRKK